MKKLVGLLLVFLLTVFASGCGSENTVKTDEGAVKFQDDKVEITSEDGKSQTTIGEAGEVSLPDGYPKDVVPIIAGGKVGASTKNEDENKKVTYNVMIFTEKNIKDVVAFYKDALKDLKGLQVMETPELTTFGGQKGDYSVSVFMSVDDSGDKPRTGVNITLAPKAEWRNPR